MHEELKKIISDSMNDRFEFERNFIERAWEDEAFKQELLSNPKAVYARESGQELPREIEIEVLQETANKIYLVLPNNPAITEGELTEEALEAVAGGVCVALSLAKGTVCGFSSKISVSNANDKVQP